MWIRLTFKIVNPIILTPCIFYKPFILLLQKWDENHTILWLNIFSFEELLSYSMQLISSSSIIMIWWYSENQNVLKSSKRVYVFRINDRFMTHVLCVFYELFWWKIIFIFVLLTLVETLLKNNNHISSIW